MTGEPVELNTVALGDPAKPPLLFVHGMAGSAGLWALAYAFRLMRHYYVVAYDQRGHGLSPAPAHGYRLADQAADLERVRRQLVDRPATVVGYSYGGHIATQWAIRHPEHAAGLVVIDSPPLPLSPRDIEDLLDGLPAVLDGDFSPAGHFLDPLKENLRGDIQRRRRQIRNTKSRLEALRPTSFRQDVLADPPFSDADFRRIRCRTLLLYSTLAGHLPYAERQRALIPRGTLATIEGGHDLVTRSPGAVCDALENFMDAAALNNPLAA